MQQKADLTENPVFKELVQTEETYNHSLKFLSSALAAQITVGKMPIFGRFQTLVDQFITISNKLLSNVEESIENKEEIARREGLQGDRISLLKRFFEIYLSYTALVDEYKCLCKTKPKLFVPMNEYMMNSKSNVNRLTFDAHVIMPIQRGPRYFLLLTEIRKHNKGCDAFNFKDFDKLEALFKDSLSPFKSKAPQTPQEPPASESKEEPKQGYRFGDGTRWVLRKVFYANPKGQTATQTQTQTTTTQTTTVAASSVKTAPTKSQNVRSSVQGQQEQEEKPMVIHLRDSLPPGYQLGALMAHSLQKPNTKGNKGKTLPSSADAHLGNPGPTKS